MREMKFEKVCAAGKLRRELEDAGFKVVAVIVGRGITTIQLAADETKDPTSIVEAHDPTHVVKDLRKAYKEAATLEEKVAIIAEYLGLL